MSKFESLLKDLEQALLRLGEVLQQEKNEFIRDSAIKRFEIVFDLGWKVIKAFLEEQHNVRCASPKTCFREAFNQGLIDYDDFWLKIADLRNYTVHAYNQQIAQAVYDDLPRALSYFETLFKNIKKSLDQNK